MSIFKMVLFALISALTLNIGGVVRPPALGRPAILGRGEGAIELKKNNRDAKKCSASRGSFS